MKYKNHYMLHFTSISVTKQLSIDYKAGPTLLIDIRDCKFNDSDNSLK